MIALQIISIAVILITGIYIVCAIYTVPNDYNKLMASDYELQENQEIETDEGIQIIVTSEEELARKNKTNEKNKKKFINLMVIKGIIALLLIIASIVFIITVDNRKKTPIEIYKDETAEFQVYPAAIFGNRFVLITKGDEPKIYEGSWKKYSESDGILYFTNNEEYKEVTSFKYSKNENTKEIKIYNHDLSKLYYILKLES